MSTEQVVAFKKFLENLGGLHDATVNKASVDAVDRTFTLVIDDIYSNFEALPDYSGPKSGLIVLGHMDCVSIDYDSNNEELRIFEFSVVETDDGSSRACIRFSPAGSISLNFSTVEF